jgi:hypothetical protein
MRMRTKTAAIAAALAASLAMPTAAWADAPASPSATDGCADPLVAPLLAAFGDERSYFVAPGGDFESADTGWQLEGGAAIVAGSSDLGVLPGESSLSLPAGGSATSPAFCVDERFPSFRMATAQLGDGKTKVRVETVSELGDEIGHAGKLAPKAGRGWSLTGDLRLDPGSRTQDGGWRWVALRLSVDRSDDDADLRVDDVLIDPRMR